MRPAKLLNYLPAFIFCGFIFVFMILWFALPKESYSSQEKRMLAEFPELNAGTLFSGDFQKSLDEYMSDHIPARNFFVGLNADFELASGRNGSNGIYLGSDGYLFPKPAVRTDQLINNAQYIKEFAESIDVPVYMTVIPSSGYANSSKLPLIHEDYTDAELISDFAKGLGSRVTFIDTADVLIRESALKQLYYRTDHHWTSRGAYECYKALGKKMGFEPVPESEFSVETVTGFYGTSYSKSALWFVSPDKIELWHNTRQSKDAVTVEIKDGSDIKTNNGYFFRERLEEDDKYPVFVDGNHSLVRITNTDVEDGTLVVVKDSYAHTIVPFLSQNYRNIIMADLRYYKKDISDIVRSENADGVLLLYSLDNLSNDPYLSNLF